MAKCIKLPLAMLASCGAQVKLPGFLLPTHLHANMLETVGEDGSSP